MTEPLVHREFERILLIKPSSLGDVVQTLPILSGLRRRYPSARLAWLVASPFVELIEGHPDLDEVIPFDRKRYGRVGRSPSVSGEFIRYIAALRRRRFDLVVDLQGLFRSGFLARVTGAGVRIGPGISREMAWMFYTHRFPVETMESNAVDRMWLLGSLLGFEDAPKAFRLPIAEVERVAVGELLAECGFSADQPYAVVFPGARWETKVWPAARFAAVMDYLAAECGVPPVLAGSPSDVEACRAVAAECRHTPANLAGRTRLRQLPALIERARIVLTNDSGPMHMADALGRPLVALFGPTNPVRTGPYHQPDAVVRVDLPCSPCYRRRLSRCPTPHACMGDLEVDRVIQAVAAKLEPPEKA